MIHPVHVTVSTWVWGTGVVLQLVLLALLVARGVARQMPLFAGLLGFCSLRVVALFVLSTRMGRPGLNVLYDGFSLMDIVLQMAVLAEMAATLMRSHGGWTRLRVGIVAVVVAWAATGAWIADAMISPPGSATMNRGQFAVALCFLLVLVWASRVKVTGALWREAQGLALYSGMSLITQVERTRAAEARDAVLWAGWSYALAAIYIGVIVFWLLTMGRRQTQAIVVDMKSWQVAPRMVS